MLQASVLEPVSWDSYPWTGLQLGEHGNFKVATDSYPKQHLQGEMRTAQTVEGIGWWHFLTSPRDSPPQSLHPKWRCSCPPQMDVVKIRFNIHCLVSPRHTLCAQCLLFTSLDPLFAFPHPNLYLRCMICLHYINWLPGSWTSDWIWPLVNMQEMRGRGEGGCSM